MHGVTSPSTSAIQTTSSSTSSSSSSSLSNSSSSTSTNIVAQSTLGKRKEPEKSLVNNDDKDPKIAKSDEFEHVMNNFIVKCQKNTFTTINISNNDLTNDNRYYRTRIIYYNVKEKSTSKSLLVDIKTEILENAISHIPISRLSKLSTPGKMFCIEFVQKESKEIRRVCINNEDVQKFINGVDDDYIKNCFNEIRRSISLPSSSSSSSSSLPSLSSSVSAKPYGQQTLGQSLPLHPQSLTMQQTQQPRPFPLPQPQPQLPFQVIAQLQHNQQLVQNQLTLAQQSQQHSQNNQQPQTQQQFQVPQTQQPRPLQQQPQYPSQPTMAQQSQRLSHNYQQPQTQQQFQVRQTQQPRPLQQQPQYPSQPTMAQQSQRFSHNYQQPQTQQQLQPGQQSQQRYYHHSQLTAQQINQIMKNQQSLPIAQQQPMQVTLPQQPQLGQSRTLTNQPQLAQVSQNNMRGLQASSTSPKRALLNKHLNKRYAHERWLDANQAEKPCYWNENFKMSLEDILFKLFMRFSEIDCTIENLDVNLSKLEQKMKSGTLYPDYSIPLLLFQLSSYQNDLPALKKIEDCIMLAVRKMNFQDKGELARFVGLIDSKQGQHFRNILFPLLYIWGDWCHNRTELYQLNDENIYGWLSVQETLRRSIKIAQGFSEAGFCAFGKSRYVANQNLQQMLGNEEQFEGACALTINSFHNMLIELEAGIEHQLPKYYHGFGSAQAGEKIIPSTMLTDNAKIVQSDTSRFAGAFIATKLPPEYGLAHLVFGNALDSRPFWEVLNFSPERTENPSGAERWIGLLNTIPITSKDSEGATTTASHIVGVVSASLSSQKQIVRESDCKNVRVLGFVQALIEQTCIEHAIPFLQPIHWPTFATQTQEHFAASKTSKVNLSFLAMIEGLKYSPWNGDREALKALFIKYTIKNRNGACHDILDGALTPSAPIPTLNRQRSEGYEREVLDLKKRREKKFKELQTAFPGVLPPPALRHIHDHIISNPTNDQVYGTVVGNNPYHVLNSHNIQSMLFDFASTLWNRLSEQQQDDFIMHDNDVFNKFYTSLAYIIIAKSYPSIDPDTILANSKMFSNKDTCKITVAVNFDSFEIGESHGRDGRKQPNEPAYIFKLIHQLTVIEKDSLKRNLLKGEVIDLEEKSVHRINLIIDLLTEMGEAIQKRYFSSSSPGRDALPQRINNSGLLKIFEGYSRTDIENNTNMLTSDYIKDRKGPRELINISRGDAIRAFSRTSRAEKELWKALEHLNFPKAVNPRDACYALSNNPEAQPETFRLSAETILEPTANTIAYLMILSKVNNNPTDLLEKAKKLIEILPIYEKGKLLRLMNTLDGEIYKPVCQTIYELLNLDPKKFLPTKEFLLRANHYVSQKIQALSDGSAELKSYEEWKSHIDARLEKLAQGEEVQLLRFCYQFNEENSSIIAFSDVLQMFNDNEAFSDLKRFDTVVFNTSKSKHSRACAVLVVGNHSDPHARIPIWTGEALKLESNYLLEF